MVSKDKMFNEKQRELDIKSWTVSLSSIVEGFRLEREESKN